MLNGCVHTESSILTIQFSIQKGPRSLKGKAVAKLPEPRSARNILLRLRVAMGRIYRSTEPKGSVFTAVLLMRHKNESSNLSGVTQTFF